MKKLPVLNLTKTELANLICDEIAEIRQLQIEDMHEIIDDAERALKAYEERFRHQAGQAEKESKKRRDLNAHHKKLLKMMYAFFHYFQAIKEQDIAANLPFIAVLSDKIDYYRKALLWASYRKTIEVVKLFVDAINQPNEKKAIQALRLDYLVDKLSKSNQNFEAIYEEGFVRSGKEKEIRWQNAMQDLREIYRTILSVLEIKVKHHPSVALLDFVERHDMRIKQLKQTVGQRRQKSPEKIKKRAKELTSIALKLGWQLSAGQEVFMHYGNKTLLNPDNNKWYKIRKRKEVYTLVDLEEAKQKHLHSLKPKQEPISLESFHKNEITTGCTTLTDTSASIEPNILALTRSKTFPISPFPAFSVDSITNSSTLPYSQESISGIIEGI